MWKALKSKTLILGALFIFAYQGAEVSISGWVISFLIATRHGSPPAVGYVTSGFWGGITLGRFLLSHPAHKVGEKIFILRDGGRSSRFRVDGVVGSSCSGGCCGGGHCRSLAGTCLPMCDGHFL
jgi:hypothetical protein